MENKERKAHLQAEIENLKKELKNHTDKSHRMKIILEIGTYTRELRKLENSNGQFKSIVEETYEQFSLQPISDEKVTKVANGKIEKERAGLDRYIRQLKIQKEENLEKIKRMKHAIVNMDNGTGAIDRAEADVKSVEQRNTEIDEMIQRKIREFNKFEIESKNKDAELTKRTSNENEEEKVSESVSEYNIALYSGIPRFDGNPAFANHSYLLKETAKNLIKTSKEKVKIAVEQKKKHHAGEIVDQKLGRLETVTEEKQKRIEEIDKQIPELQEKLEAAKAKNLVGSVKSISDMINNLKQEKEQLIEDGKIKKEKADDIMNRKDVHIEEAVKFLEENTEEEYFAL